MSFWEESKIDLKEAIEIEKVKNRRWKNQQRNKLLEAFAIYKLGAECFFNYLTKSKRKKLVAAVLSVFLGGIGLHKFYLGKWKQGIAYILISFTFIPVLLGVVEGIRYIFMSQEKFDKKYND